MSDVRKLDLNLLKALVVLLDEQNVSRAAARLSITQPAMSGILNRLRAAFNDPLFVRVQHGILPTDRAAELGQTARRVLRDVGAMLEPAAFEPQSLAITLRIGAMDYIQQIIALPLILRLRRLAPNVQVALLPVQGQNIKAMFEQHKIDLAVVSADHLSADLHQEKLYDERYICAMSKSHPMAKTPLSADTFSRLPFAMLSYNGGEFSGATDTALDKLGYSRKVMVSMNNILLLPKFLEGSDLVAVLPEKLAQSLPNMHLQDAPVDIEGFSMHLAWHERTHHDAVHRWLRKVLGEVAGSPPAPSDPPA